MSDPSPPVRVTRARAAAKVDPKLSIATAASKAKATRATASTASATAKRRTRNDDHKDDEEDELAETMKEIIEPEAPKTRGRQKKVVATEPVAKEAPITAPRTRGRPKKETIDTPAPEPTRITRGRAKKVPEVDTAEEEVPITEPVKRATRGRAATVTKPAPPKKTVKFEESGKENIAPTTKAKSKAEVATGLKAKPVRKPASTTTTRATRGRPKVEEEPKSSPLSPKKVTQVATAKDRDNSDDELATTEKTPMPLMKSPIKPPGSLFNAAKKIDFTNSNTISVHKVSVSQDLSASIMASPARRPPQSPFKDALKASPQKLVLGDSIMMRSPVKPSFPAPQSAAKNPDPKASLLQSPARRPQSPMKVSEAGSPNKLNSSASSGQTPRASTFKISRFGTPKTISRTPRNAPFSSIKTLPSPVPEDSTTTSLKFSGRLSSIMPREADPALKSPEAVNEEGDTEEIQIQDLPTNEPMILDETEETITVDAPETTAQPSHIASSDTTEQNPAFCLREREESPFDSDSEDELASESPRYSPVQLTEFNVSAHDFATSPATPTPFNVANKTPKTNISSKRPARRSEIGFTPLARQLSSWMAASPESDHSSNASDQEHPSPLRSNPIDFSPASLVQESPAKSTYFEDEMLVRDDIAVSDEAPIILEQDPNFTPVELIEEDLELAAEADEMSVLQPDEIQNDEEVMTPTEENTAEDLVKVFIVTPAYEQTNEYFEEVQNPVEPADAIEEDVGPAPSEASQEYGDENAIPIDPTLLALPGSQQPAFATPKRVLTERVFHTVSKVPLKPAAEESPMKGPSKKRSASISRLPVSRPSSNLSRSNTVISYSPSKNTARRSQQAEDEDVQMAEAPVTPSKPATVDWSTVGTPARTPRRDLSTTLLKGAVVFVDVHTSEGADASVLFTELLTEMGARCVKTWNWTPTSEDGSKIGITHVVFKDGGRRTLEKARATGGVVACVGVGWVLDCERENKWLDEASYAVDTAEVPRGGHRRRKSMEPRALANLNGTLMTPSAKTPGRSPTKDSFGILETPGTSKSVRRRESVQWVRSPASSNSNDDHLDDQTMALSPIPATPGPDTISAYGEAYLDQLNAGEQTPGGAETPYFLHKEKLIQMTAPPKQRYDVDGNGVLSEKKDESVMMRLMAARRKSLQWAPKIGSPLAKSAGWGA